MLATLVIVSHSWPVSGAGADPGWGDQDLGDWAVAGFFAISGYLITGSRIVSRNLTDYLWRRFLRIYPAFLAALLVVALVIAPLSVILDGSGHYNWASGVTYVLKNLGLYTAQLTIEGTLTTVPYPSAWNAPLWTLFYEFACYLIIALIVSIIPLRFIPSTVIAWFALSTAGTVVFLVIGDGDESPLVRMLRLGGFFAAGAILFLFRDKIPSSAIMAGAAGLLVVTTMATGTFQALGGLPVAYLMMYLGARLPLGGIGSRNDISYGMYIYAFPIQQVLAMTLPSSSPLWVFITLSVVCTVPLAWASWLLIERNAMKLKILTARRPERLQVPR